MRVLQEKQIQPLGSSKIINVNVRVITATNRNLERDIISGWFHSDLYYRLNVFPLYLPPLRERGTDKIMLADHFVLKFAKELNKPVKRISTPVLEAFLAYQWPGNVRELEHCIERTVLLANGDTLDVFHLPPSLQMKTKDGEKKEQGKLRNVVESQERVLIINALKETQGNQSKAAKLLGTTKRITQYKIQKFGIDPWQFRPKWTGSTSQQAEKEESQTDV